MLNALMFVDSAMFFIHVICLRVLGGMLAFAAYLLFAGEPKVFQGLAFTALGLVAVHLFEWCGAAISQRIRETSPEQD